jgi:hypothetical protein
LDDAGAGIIPELRIDPIELLTNCTVWTSCDKNVFLPARLRIAECAGKLTA